MTAQPFKTIVLKLLQQGHLDEEEFLQEQNETERTAIGTPERWSVKDHVAHRTFWQERTYPLHGHVAGLFSRSLNGFDIRTKKRLLSSFEERF